MFQTIFELLGFVFFLGPLLLLVGTLFSGGSRGTLVLQKFDLNQAPQPLETPIVNIVGRPQGLIAFILTSMGFNAITKLTLTYSEVRCETASLFGQRFQFIPLHRVGTFEAGVHKPIATLLAAAMLLFLGGSAGIAADGIASLVIILLAILISAALVALYFFSKKFFIAVHPFNGPSISLIFKPSAIEGVPVDVEYALEVIAVMRDLITTDGAESPAMRQPVTPQPVNRQAVGAPPPLPTVAQRSVPAGDPETEAREAFAEAKQLFDSGHKTQAIQMLERIVQDYPDTVAGRSAEKSLQRLSNYDN